MKDEICYSQSTVLAYYISKEYFNDEHYLWCCSKPFYTVSENQPASSNPLARCAKFIEEIVTHDNHEKWLTEHKNALRKGAEAKLKAKVITAQQKKKIIKLIREAPSRNLWPILCVIPLAKANSYLEEVPKEKKANKDSEEYLAKNLPGDCFDVIKIENALPSVLIEEGNVL